MDQEGAAARAVANKYDPQLQWRTQGQQHGGMAGIGAYQGFTTWCMRYLAKYAGTVEFDENAGTVQDRGRGSNNGNNTWQREAA